MKTLVALMLFFSCVVVQAATFKSISPEPAQIVTETPKVNVALPASYKINGTERYPVLYVLDGDLNAELVYRMLHRLHASSGAKEHIIVGIASENRLRDFAPTVNLDPRGPVGEGGGGDRFLDYMENVLIPHIDGQYRTNEFNVIAGHSVAGLLVVHSFHSRPELFQAHMAFSPAVWWGARETAIATEEYVVSDEPIQNFLYMDIGSENGEMREVYDSLAKTLLRNRNLDLTLQFDKFDHVQHDLTMAAGLFNALTGLNKYQHSVGM
ncbi:alpha/beta hydrolase [Alteromonas facilis]|uniref:alpha/beta hydrolase n=1 Tax=Alteromonas facilis TaxID=2048004 RepID=UPI001F0C3A54|nr:alpha/beta hydrolase-fold protein [Alteromonas facilis]